MQLMRLKYQIQQKILSIPYLRYTKDLPSLPIVQDSECSSLVQDYRRCNGTVLIHFF